MLQIGNYSTSTIFIIISNDKGWSKASITFIIRQFLKPVDYRIEVSNNFSILQTINTLEKFVVR